MELIKDHQGCYLVYSKIVELTGIIYRLFDSTLTDIDLTTLYDQETLECLRQEYILVGEVLLAHKGYGPGILESLTEYMMFDDIVGYRKHIEGLSKDMFLYKFYGLEIERELFQKALEDDQALKVLYKEAECIKSFTTFKMVIKDSESFIQEYFELMEKLCTESFEVAFGKLQEEAVGMVERINQALDSYEEPLHASEALMGKTFYNRGPYEKFVFIPTKYISNKICRFNLTKHQIMLLNIRSNPYTTKDLIKMMKLMGDESRFRLMELISKEKPMMGKELAEALGVSTPTISHHIEQLKEAGLINEERQKQYKYYTLQKENMRKFLETVKQSLKL